MRRIMPIDKDSVGIFIAGFDDFGGFWVTPAGAWW
jgi:hypothetical protein